MFFLSPWLLLFPVISFSVSAAASGESQKAKALQYANDQPVRFLENKGQMTDMNKKPVPYVLFKASFPGMNVFITEKGLTYMFIRTEEKTEPENNSGSEINGEEKIETAVAWVNLLLDGAEIKRENIVSEGAGANHNNYFYPHCNGGIYGVRQYEKITVRNIYPGIDWVLYGTEKTGMKYDFIVRAGSNAGLIKLIYESGEPLSLNEEGDVVIKTPLGTLVEKAPYAFLEISLKEIASRYITRQTDAHHVQVRFEISDYGLNTLVIDPQLWWGTMYGGSTDELDGPSSMDVDPSGNLYVAGYTTSPDFPVMNAGTYYDSVLVGGVYDLFLMKFSNSGVLLWSTYYGGSGDERSPYEVPFITTDPAGDIFITGETFSDDLPLQNAGTFFDSIFDGSLNYISDAFILKFDSAGNRLWATYFGGNNQDRAVGAATDPSGNLIITGFTNSTAGFPYQSWGAAYFDSTFNGGTSDAFVARFTNSGNLTWSTCLGGSGEDHALSAATDAAGNIFLTGETASANFPLQNNGTYFDDTLGGTDAFMVKFNSNGQLTWSTYFGGSAAFGLEWGLSLRCDPGDNVFVMGYTNSTDFPLVNAGTYFDSLIGFADKDMFISKFSNAGSLLWSTYYGGGGNVNTSWDFMTYDNLEIDTSGNVYISFNRGTDSVGTFDPGCGSYIDSIGRIALAEFSNTGEYLWGTYIGAANGELRGPLAVDRNNNLFMGGEFNGYSSIAGLPLMNPGGGAYYSTALGPASANNHQAFQLKFIPDAPCVIVTNFVANDNHICPGSCINFINATTGATSYQWLFPGAVPDSSTDINPQNICYNTSGSYPVTLVAANAGGSDTLLLNNYITVYPSPPPQAILQSGDTLFANAGAAMYQWYFNGTIIAGATDYFYLAMQSGDHNVVATDANGCEVEAVIFNVVANVTSSGIGNPLMLYPNPSAEELFVSCPDINLSTVIGINTMLGERVACIQQRTAGSHQVSLDIRSLQSGIYWLEVITDKQIRRSKFIKEAFSK